MPSKTPIYYKKDANRYFYSIEEFNRYIIKKVKKTINKWRMLEIDSKIAVAVSGGKDSMSLLYILEKIEREFPSELYIIHVDEGIKGYSDKNLEVVKNASRELGLPLYITSYRELFDYNIDKVANISIDERRFAPCTFCGVWRRWAINYLALKAGADRVATAHSLDDEAQTILMNILKGSLENILKLKPYPERVDNIVPRIKPFRELYEKEIALYAMLNNIPYNDIPCPYAEEGMRWDIRIWLYEQEDQRPGTLFNIVRFGERIVTQTCIHEKAKEIQRINKCSICGFPSAKSVCKAHELMLFLKKKAMK